MSVLLCLVKKLTGKSNKQWKGNREVGNCSEYIPIDMTLDGKANWEQESINLYTKDRIFGYTCIVMNVVNGRGGQIKIKHITVI